MDIEFIKTFVINNVEYIVSVIAGVITILVINGKKYKGRRCNLNRFIIKHNKQTQMLHQQSKASTTLFSK